jgi:hypothetical protein
VMLKKEEIIELPCGLQCKSVESLNEVLYSAVAA